MWSERRGVSGGMELLEGVEHYGGRYKFDFVYSGVLGSLVMAG